MFVLFSWECTVTLLSKRARQNARRSAQLTPHNPRQREHEVARAPVRHPKVKLCPRGARIRYSSISRTSPRSNPSWCCPQRGGRRRNNGARVTDSPVAPGWRASSWLTPKTVPVQDLFSLWVGVHRVCDRFVHNKHTCRPLALGKVAENQFLLT
jgi:hypothetical protein